MKNNEDKFTFVELTNNDLKTDAVHDFGKLYERAHAELSLQQTK